MAKKAVKRVGMASLMGESKIVQADRFKYLLQTGALFDIYTGKIMRSTLTDDDGKPLYLVNGGVPTTTLVLGRPNRGKTTLKNFLMHQPFSRIYRVADTSLNSYDTENSADIDRQSRLATETYPGYGGEDIFAKGIWKFTQKLQTSGTVWYEDYKFRMKNKIKNKRFVMMDTIIYDRYKKAPLQVIMPTGGDIDSISELDTEASQKQLDKAALGSMDAQTIYMNLGLQRTNMLKALPSLAHEANDYMFMTAHVDDKIEMAAGPGKAPKQKQLQTLRNNDAPKGVPSKAFFLIYLILQVVESIPLIKSDTRTPMLPKDTNDNNKPSKDLVRMNILIARSKICESGREFTLLSSQKDGILPALSTYYFIKYTNKDYGIGGTQQKMFVEIYPDVTFSRTTIRGLLDTDPKLARAVSIVGDMKQMEERMYHLVKDVLITPAELYKKIIDLGYDWDLILTKTRSWQVPNDELIEDTRLLITYDILRLANGDITLKELKMSSKGK